MFECVCCYVICFGIVCVIFSQLLWFFSVLFAWFLNDAYSVVILVLFHLLRVLEIIFHFLSVHIRIYYKYPVEAKKREILPFFFLLACHFWANLLELCVWVLFPFLYRHLLGDYLFFIIHLFSVKIRKQDGFVSVWFRLFAYFLCFFVSVSHVSKGGETQNKNSVCCHFKLDLESKLKNTTALSAHKLKTRLTTTHIRLISVRAFLGGGEAILVLHAVGVIESSSWPTVFCLFVSPPQIKPLKFLQKGEDITMFYIVSSVSLFCLLILSLYH